MGKGENEMKSFKQLVQMIHDIETEDDRNKTWGEINKSFESDKITWKDHEMLYDLASMVRVTAKRCRYE